MTARPAEISAAIEARRIALADHRQAKDLQNANREAIRTTAAEIAANEDLEINRARLNALSQDVSALPEPLSAARVANLRLKVAGCQAAEPEIEADEKAASREVGIADRALKRALREHLNSTVRPEALAQLAEGWSKIQTAAEQLMAIYHLEEIRFRDPRGYEMPYTRLEQQYGPIAELLADIQAMRCSEYPYSPKPNFISKSYTWRSYNLPGVAASQKQIVNALGVSDL